MKKILSILFVGMLISTTAFSQMNTGSYFLSGSIPLNLELYSYNDLDNTDVKENGQVIGFSPKGGYFLKNRLAIGGIVDYSVNRNTQEYTVTGDKYTYKTRQLLLGPLGRYYFEYGTFMPFAEAFLGIGKSTSVSIQDFVDGSTETKTSHSVFKTAVGGGANYFLNDAIAMEALLQFFWEKQKPTEGTGSGHASTGIMLQVGVSIYFGSI